MANNHWQTPGWLADRLRDFGPVKLDPCTTKENPVGAEYIRTADCDPDGLQTPWREFGGLVYVNPPYGRGQMMRWARKILEEHSHGCEIIALTRGDTSTAWAHALIKSAARMCFPPRIRFRDATGSPNFSNLLFYFGAYPQSFELDFGDLGPCR